MSRPGSDRIFKLARRLSPRASELQKLFNHIAAGEPERERILPIEVIDLIRRSRLGALRIPAAAGGSGTRHASCSSGTDLEIRMTLIGRDFWTSASHYSPTFRSCELCQNGVSRAVRQQPPNCSIPVRKGYKLCFGKAPRYSKLSLPHSIAWGKLAHR
jgi:hypothetical protein